MSKATGDKTALCLLGMQPDKKPEDKSNYTNKKNGGGSGEVVHSVGTNITCYVNPGDCANQDG